jgi:hypothetical protein
MIIIIYQSMTIVLVEFLPFFSTHIYYIIICLNEKIIKLGLVSFKLLG